MSYVYVSLKRMCGSSHKRKAYLRNKVANSRPAQLDDSRGTICKKDKVSGRNLVCSSQSASREREDKRLAF
jgi:hypothetical protein